MVIIGIDPGTATIGYGIVEKTNTGVSCLEYGCIQTSKLKKAHERLLSLEKDLVSLLNKHKPTIMVIERLYFFKNVKTALPVSEAKGVILLQAAKKKMAVHELTPLQAKMAITGYGRAEKLQVSRMVQKTLNLQTIPKPDDAADALGIALAFALSRSFIQS